MTKKMKLVWRFNKLPYPQEITHLIEKGVITKEEAKDILFNSEEVEDRDKSSLEEEIKFLRELVEKLAKSRSQIVEIIREVQPVYHTYTWTQPYITWCNTASDTNYLNGNTVSFNSITTF